MGKIAEIVQALIKVFVRSNKRFPQGQEIKEIQSQARQVLDGALTHNLDQAKGKNLDDIDVMEKTMDKNADQLIDDYLSNEEIKGRMTSEPTFTQVDERKLPRAEIEALPLKDKEKAEAAVRKKLEAQNVQARQSREGGETPGGPQRGRPEVVDKSFGKTVYVDKSEMEERMNQAYRQFEAAEDALSAGNTDEARGILRYEIEENYKFPKNVRDAAADARYMIIRGEGIDAKDFENLEEATQELREKIQFGKNQTAPDNYPDITDPLEGEPQNVEYVSFFDEPGEDFGTPNSVITDIDKLDFKEGGRVGMAAGGIMKAINILVKTKKMGADRAADLVDLIEQAKKAGIPIKTMNDLENFEKQIRGASNKVYESRKKYPGVEGEKSGLPLDENLRKLTDDELDELYEEFDEAVPYPMETVADKNKFLKEQKEYMDYMYDQYKTGKLDPQPGEKSRSRMKYLQAKKEEAEMTDDFRLFTPDDRDELEFLEAEFEYKDLREKLDSPRKMTDEDLKKLKEFDDSGFENFSKEMNRINRNKKAKGGLGYLMGF